jgi:hypothetical protein
VLLLILSLFISANALPQVQEQQNKDKQLQDAQKKIEQLQETAKKPEPWDVEGGHGPTTTVEFDTDEGTSMSCDVSPDGRGIVFDLVGDIYRMPISGGGASLQRRFLGVAAALVSGRQAHRLHLRPRRRRQHMGDGCRRA